MPKIIPPECEILTKSFSEEGLSLRVIQNKLENLGFDVYRTTVSQGNSNSGIIPSAKSRDNAPNDNMSGESKEKVCRVVIQQCTSANLRFDTADPPVSIRNGMVVFVCFLQGATIEHLDNIVKSVLQVKLCEPQPEGSSRDSVLQCEMDVLVIPQATLGGKIKGKSVQYHGLVSKALGESVFENFVEKVKDSVQSQGEGKVQSGVYGARQILTMETNGPFTHIFDF